MLRIPSWLKPYASDWLGSSVTYIAAISANHRHEGDFWLTRAFEHSGVLHFRLAEGVSGSGHLSIFMKGMRKRLLLVHAR